MPVCEKMAKGGKNVIDFSVIVLDHACIYGEWMRERERAREEDKEIQ